MHRKYLSSCISCVVFLLLGGCSLGPDYERPKVDLPAATSSNAEVEKFLGDEWWLVFRDPVLDKLENMAIERNADIKQAAATIEEACAAAGVATSEFLPSIGLEGSYSDTKLPSKLRPAPGETNMVKSSATVGLSYELDFWGKYRRAAESADAMVMASMAMKEAVRLTITSEVAKAYFMLLALDAKLAIARRTLRTREDGHKIYKSRFENGYCAELDYLRIESEMSSVRATVLDLEANLEKVESTLNVLTGASPRVMVSRRVDRQGSIERLRIPSVVPSGLPANLLERRPDVVQAEGQLMAANAEIGKALAAHFPSFSLTTAFGFESVALRHLFSDANETTGIRGMVSLPFFACGKFVSLGRIAEAKYKKALAAYEKTVQTAFKETLDAIASNRKSREVVTARTKQMRALRKSYNIAKVQKSSGLIGLIDLLDVERGLLAAEMELVGALQNRLNATVDLCKALGGGWHSQKL